MLHFSPGPVFTGVTGDISDVSVLRALLTKEAKGETVGFLYNSKFYTGLLPYITSRIDGKIPYQITGSFVERDAEMADIDIPLDYLASDVDPGFTLRDDYQPQCIRKAIYNKRGIVTVATGGGKTEIAAGIVKWVRANTDVDRALIMVGQKNLAEQIIDRFHRRGVEGVGYVGGGKKKDFESPITVATAQTLYRGIKAGDVDILRVIAGAGLLLPDETHHMSSDSWTRIGEICEAEYRIGLSATPYDNPEDYDARDFRLMGLTGPSVVTIRSKFLRKRGHLAEPITAFINPSEVPVDMDDKGMTDWHKVYDRCVVGAESRNRIALHIAKQFYDNGHKVLLFVDRIEHGQMLQQALGEAGYESFFTMGDSKVDLHTGSALYQQKMKAPELAKFVNDARQCIGIGSPVINEGVDIPSFDTLIMLAGGRSHRKTLQRVGRGMRPKPEQATAFFPGGVVYLLDFWDNHHPYLLAQSKARWRTYDLEEYTIYDNLMSISRYLDFSLMPVAI